MHAFGRDIPPDPLPLFRQWLAEARPVVRYPHAACLSTLALDGFPDGRMVLVHEATDAGFLFLTDTRSPKAQALAATPRAALTYYWAPLERQVRLRGPVTPAPDADADRCFAERPRQSRATAWAALQSRPLPDPAALHDRVAAYDTRFRDVDPIPRPLHWQGYRLRPHTIEFWQAGARRLHERIRYHRKGDGWACTRLEP